MKKFILIICVSVSMLFTSCSSDDSSDGNNTQTTNIKYEITTSRNSSAIITVTLNNETQTEEVDNLPYSITYAQTEVSNGTYVKLTYLENGDYVVTPQGSSWTDYTAELKIYSGENVIKSEVFTITENNSGIKTIDYTFN